MKYIHIPTLALHGGILILASLTLDHYPDTFLALGVPALIGHLIWAIRSKKRLGISHLLGCAAELAIFSLGLIEYSSGGLSGSEFALFFYQIALGVSAALESLVMIYRLFHKQ